MLYDPNKKIIVDQIWNMNELVSSEVYFHDGQVVFNKYKNRNKYVDKENYKQHKQNP